VPDRFISVMSVANPYCVSTRGRLERPQPATRSRARHALTPAGPAVRVGVATVAAGLAEVTVGSGLADVAITAVRGGAAGPDEATRGGGRTGRTGQLGVTNPGPGERAWAEPLATGRPESPTGPLHPAAARTVNPRQQSRTRAGPCIDQVPHRQALRPMTKTGLQPLCNSNATGRPKVRETPTPTKSSLFIFVWSTSARHVPQAVVRWPGQRARSGRGDVHRRAGEQVR